MKTSQSVPELVAAARANAKVLEEKKFRPFGKSWRGRIALMRKLKSFALRMPPLNWQRLIFSLFLSRECSTTSNAVRFHEN